MRMENWPKRLNEVIEAARVQPFAWGSHDCCLFAADCALAITGGVDAAASYRGTYSTETEAQAIIEAAGGFVALINSAMAAVGWRRCMPRVARRGDIVCHTPAGGSPALGVCVGSQCAFLTASGLRFVALNECQIAWRVD